MEAQLDSVVNEALPLHARPNPNFGKQVDGTLFEYAGPNALFDVLPAAILDHDRVDPFPI
jgi:hypothetical protein